MDIKQSLEDAYWAKHAAWKGGARRPSVRNVCEEAGIGRKYLATNHPELYEWLLTRTSAADKRQQSERAASKATEQDQLVERLRDKIRKLEDTVTLLARQVQAEILGERQ